ncbi:MAG: cytosolic protein [Magnetococcales bacterium]|nr:cytosolic protein [Magnetococcales bacterium]
MTDHDNQSQPTEYDSPWKEILKAYLKDFLEFFLPDAHDGIDWQRAPEFLDKELDRITREAESGNRRVDLLVRVWLLDGDELWVLIHVEVQGNRDPHFEERMFTCQYRAFDLYKRPVVSLAILADEEGAWRPSAFGYQKWGSKVSFQFNAIKLLDYLSRMDLLESSTNPFAIVTLAHLTGKQTRNQPTERFQQKMRITRMLYERGFSRQQIVNLFRFIDWVLNLPEELDNQFWTNLSNFEENKKMPYITSVERIGEERGRLMGIQIGRQEEAASMLLKLIRRKFGATPDWVTEKVKLANLELIETWSDNFVFANSVDDVFAS